MARPVETMRRRDPQAVRHTLTEWLAPRFPGQRVDVARLTVPDSGGLSNETFLLDVEVDDQVVPLVAQAAPAGEGLFPVYDIPTMFRLQEDLRRVDIPVPGMRWLERDASVLGAPFYVMDRVGGRVPDETPSYHQAGWLFAATAAQREQVWWSAVSALAALNRLDPNGFDYLTEVHWGMPLDGDPVEYRVRQWREFLRWSSPDDDPPALLKEVWDVLLERRPPAPPSLSINWGDAKLTNMMVSDFEVAALLDWELCGIGAAEEDLAHLLMIDWLLSLSSGGQRASGLPSRQETVAVYQELLGRPLVGVDWWFTFSLTRVTAHSHRMMERQRSLGLLAADADLGAANSLLPLLAHELAVTA